jgi:hypothetical protein
MKHKVGDQFRCEADIYTNYGSTIRKGTIVTVCDYSPSGSYILAEHPMGRFGMYEKLWTKLPKQPLVDKRYESLYT